MAVDRLAEIGERDPARVEMLVAQHDLAAADQRADIGDDAHEALRQHLEQMLVEQRTDLDREPRLLAHLARERRAMILARIGPAARQVPFAALVQQQQHAAVVDQDDDDDAVVIRQAGGRCARSPSPIH